LIKSLNVNGLKMLNQNYLNSICYIIVVADNYSGSFFNGYDSFIIRNSNVFRIISTLPKNMGEIFAPVEAMIGFRMSGLHDGYKVRFCSSIDAACRLPYEFKVAFVADEADLSKISRALFLSSAVASVENHRSVGLESLDFSTVRKNLLEVSKELSKKALAYITELEEVLSYGEVDLCIDTNYKFARSIYNRASLDVLSSLKVSYSFEDVGLQWDEEDVMKPLGLLRRLQLDIAKTLDRSSILPHVDLVLSDMSSNLGSLVFKQNYTQNYLKNDGHTDPGTLVKALTLINRNTISEGLRSNPFIVQFYEERLLLEAMVALYAASYASATIKMPLANRDLFGYLKDIGIIDRGSNSTKVGKQVAGLVSELEKFLEIPLKFIPSTSTSAIKIVSNLPVEWGIHNGLPLMVRHEVSRIPVSPGSPATMLLLDGEQICLTIDNLKKIRVISSFEESDKRKDDLEKRVNIVTRRAYDAESLAKHRATLGVTEDFESVTPLELEIEWFKVNSADEFRSSLLDNDCAITIFNMHGGHDLQGAGSFAVGKDLVSLYDFIDEFQASPIVVLCSCDTNPIDRNHYSTASAFLRAGAKTVLASALPILSKEASIFVARLLLRIQLYLPRRLSAKDGVSVRWSSFVSGMVRRSYYSELFELLANKFVLSPNTKRDLNYFAGTRVDPLSENWHEDILQYTSTKTGLAIATIEQFIVDYFALPECLKYIQIGNPESIILVAENHIPIVK